MQIDTILMNNPVYDQSELYLRHISIDNVILGYHNKELKVLLQRPQGFNKWLLPGGYLKRTETLIDAAERIAKERTNLDNLFLKQFGAFGSPDRTKDSDFTPQKLSDISDIIIDDKHWMFDYFVSICFYTLTDFEKVQPNGDAYMEECVWWSVDNVPPMLYDHKDMINSALKTLRLHLYHYPIGYELLPKKFTLPEIHSLYETILNKELDIRNFGKKLIATGIIKKLDEKKKIGAHRSPYLYMFDDNQYKDALNKGIAIIL